MKFGSYMAEHGVRNRYKDLSVNVSGSTRYLLWESYETTLPCEQNAQFLNV